MWTLECGATVFETEGVRAYGFQNVRPFREVAFVQDDAICEFDLTHEQVHDGALVFLAEGELAVGKRFVLLELTPKIDRIHDRHHRVEPRDVAERAAVLLLERKSRRDRHPLLMPSR